MGVASKKKEYLRRKIMKLTERRQKTARYYLGTNDWGNAKVTCSVNTLTHGASDKTTADGSTTHSKDALERRTNRAEKVKKGRAHTITKLGAPKILHRK